MTESMPAPAAVPGKGLGIAGLIFAFLIPLIGLILSIIAKVQSNRAGVKNAPATWGIIVSIVLIVIGVIVWVTLGATLFSACSSYGPGVHYLDNGTTLTCG